MTDWHQQSERGSRWGMALLFWLYRHGGRFVILPIVYLVVFYFFLTRASTRRYSRLYLRRTGSSSGWWQVWLHHLSFARALLDRIAAWMGRLKRTDVDFSGHQLLLQLQREKKGAVMLGAHFGNLEMCRAVVENEGALKLNVILHTANTQNFNRLMDSASDQVQVRLIQVTEVTPATAIELRQKLDDGEFLILLADRLPPGNQQRYFAHSFLGAPAHFPVGPFWLALLLQAPVFFMAGYRTEKGYRAELQPLYNGAKVARSERDEKCRTLLTDFVQQLEPLCRRYPLQWFNFYDFWGDDKPRHATDDNQES
ncbi:hypothetical protein [Gilvimarinus sp. DA14]|uniref:LpxL/LpxP family acyltransferase n=1 Tax=Gilvimarinus sp. DA14 TaxID=2956798 RepID=UPI0020B81A04|nr:hypothetical protein [Gilvimarinus sp. DA14]UTF59728.1 hypothetical protein NHM04_14835 [Gilvimarinus sp. DA14]